MLSGGFVFYEYIATGIGILSIYLSKVFLLSSIIAIIIPAKTKIKCVHKNFTSLLIWIILMTATIGILFILNKIQNRSPTLFATEFYWEEGIDVTFRKNGTYRALNHYIFGGEITYGRYLLQDSMIILLDKMKFGNSNMNDTLLATGQGIFFTMEEPWRIEEGTMSYVYGQATEFPITNKTTYKIDSISIKLSYAGPENKPTSLEPNKSVKYKFELKNPYVDGRYILSYSILDGSSEPKEIENITNGFPIETVKEILFHDNYVTIETIFGNKITKPI